MSEPSHPETVSQPEVVERVLALKSLELFAHLEPAELTPLADRLERVEVASAERLLREDEPVAFVIFVLEGILHERRHGARLREVGPRDAVGLADLLAGTRGGVEVSSTRHSMALRASRETLLAAMEDSFPIQQAILRALGRAALDAASTLGSEPPMASRPSPQHGAGAEPDLAERIAVLRRTPLLRAVRVHTLGQLALDATGLPLERGEVLWRRGDSADHAVLLLQGRVGLQAEPHPDLEAGGGQLLGLEECLAERPREREAVVRESGAALRLQIESLLDALEDDPDVSLDLMTALAVEVTARLDRLAAQRGAGGVREQSAREPGRRP